MKIKSKVYIHPLYYLVALIFFFTGYFKYFSIYTLIIIVHECGHIFAGLVLKWPIKKVTLYPFGCMTTFDKMINSSSVEEFLILIYGPLFQILFNMIYPTRFHNFILLFNLLPIYPLDGSKLLLIFLNRIISFYYSYIFVYIISFITIIILIINNINLISIVVLTYILYDLYRYIDVTKCIMYKFYYERYKYRLTYKKNHIIMNENKHNMFKEKNNFFIIKNKCYKESEILSKMFDK